jgi:uncharacterized protein (DUF58 family)
MWTNLFNRLLKNLAERGGHNQIFIVPTFDALKLLLLNGTLLIIGLVYANNFILFFNFILFCLFLGSMYYTHFNLRGLKISGARLSPPHCDEGSVLTLHLESSSRLGHYFLSLRPLYNKHLEVDSTSIFSLPENKTKSTITVPVFGKKRGSGKLSHVMLETLFPFHLFRCMIILPVEISYYVYPKRTSSILHQSRPFAEVAHVDGENFLLRNYVTGDSLKHVHWKKLAQSGELYSKIHHNQNQDPVLLSISPNENIEEQLSSIASDLYRKLQNQTPFGLKLGDQLIAPSLSQQHLDHCLRGLAKYEN